VEDIDMTATLREPTRLDSTSEQSSVKQRTEHSRLTGLTEALQGYFDLMYDCDTSRFDQVFRPTAQLHGIRDGQMVMWPAETYKDVLAKRQSPKSLMAARADEILLVDFTSPSQALTKVRVRIASMVFVDYLTWHRIDGKWLITSKGFYLESTDEAVRA
jgi:hypothetical protein